MLKQQLQCVRALNPYHKKLENYRRNINPKFKTQELYDSIQRNAFITDLKIAKYYMNARQYQGYTTQENYNLALSDSYINNPFNMEP